MFELVSSIALGAVALTFRYKHNGGGNDKAKIERIFENCGLTVKENGVKKSIQLLHRTRHDWGVEYAYRIPLGLSFADFERKRGNLQDGLNNKRSVLDVNLADLKTLRPNRQIIDQIRELINAKQKQRKEVELSYDGVLKIKVYNEALADFYRYDNSVLQRCKGWQIPVGVTRDSFVKHDFEKIPHLVVAGTTRYGKSVFLKNVTTTLISRKSADVKFTLIDLKGGLTFNRYKNARQVVTVAKDVDEALLTLRAIQSEMNLRMSEFLAAGYEDVKESKFKERHFIVIDEAAQLASKGETNAEIKKAKVA
ncbi:FtsK/SpoIIIE domain-containing protein [Bacillus sp. SCS-151]|uniref:FtsK/SpoIIIE domain-containing protein n=1 Tax=Nanhaiella sioensis TaxID=3115293 RepID=UPI00397AFB93